MKCPVDNTTLTLAERGGVEIDFCPECRGVWLDRGELDKIIERSEATTPRPAGRADYDDQRRYDDHDRRRSSHGGYDQRGGKRKRREGFLGDLFDF